MLAETTPSFSIFQDNVLKLLHVMDDMVVPSCKSTQVSQYASQPIRAKKRRVLYAQTSMPRSSGTMVRLSTGAEAGSICSGAGIGLSLFRSKISELRAILDHGKDAGHQIYLSSPQSRKANAFYAITPMATIDRLHDIDLHSSIPAMFAATLPLNRARMADRPSHLVASHGKHNKRQAAVERVFAFLVK